MRILSRKVALAAAIALFALPLHAASGIPGFQVVAFGDSLLDAGTYAPFAEKGPFNGGRFTTNPGPNFTQDIARHFGGDLTAAFVGGFGQPLAANKGGLNYAQGGSRVTMQPGIGHAPPGTPNADVAAATTIPVKAQLALYLSAHGKFNPGQLVLINGGADDIFFQLEAAEAAGTPQALRAAIDAIIRAAINLAVITAAAVANGATHVVVMNVPDIGKAPAGVFSPDHGLLLTQVSYLFNITLSAALESQRRNFRGKVLLIDAFRFTDQVVASFRTFGFTVANTATACDLPAQVKIAGGLCLKNPGSLYCKSPASFGSSLFCSPRTYVRADADRSFMFADTVHPATHFGALFALFVEQRIGAQGWSN
jgi:phospholipase/lecithinase/hemolysin